MSLTMDRMKLDYLTKRMPITAVKELYAKMDIDGYGDFNLFVCDFLENPDTTDERILRIVPVYKDPAMLEHFKRQYIEKFQYMNKLCMDNATQPLFTEGNDLGEMYKVRKELIRKQPEEVLNRFFNVDSYMKYTPPVYKHPSQPESN